MITSYITHDEAVIRHFIEDPELADLYLQTVLKDGDADEIAHIEFLYNEAKARSLEFAVQAQSLNRRQSTHTEAAVLC